MSVDKNIEFCVEINHKQSHKSGMRLPCLLDKVTNMEMDRIVYRPPLPGGNQIAVSQYHFVSHMIMSQLKYNDRLS